MSIDPFANEHETAPSNDASTLARGIFRGGGSTRKEVLTDKRGGSDKEMPIDIPAVDGPIIPRYIASDRLLIDNMTISS